MRSLFFLVILFFFLGGCYYDSVENLYPELPASCDSTTVITYAGYIAPVISNNCLSCHGNNTSDNGNGIKLEGYNNLKAMIDDNDRLYKAIAHTGNYPMPPGGQLDKCTIAAFKKWIDAGALNN